MSFISKNSPDHVSRARKLVSSLSKNSFPSRRHFAYLMHMLSPRELFVVRSLTLVILLNLAILNVYLYRTTTHMVPAVGGTLREGTVGNVRNMNPILATEKVDLELSRLLYSSLFLYDPIEKKFVPELVDQINVSEDQKTYTLSLRKDATWHDGEQLDADDVLFTIQSIMDPAYKSPLGGSLKGMTVQKQDQYTITIALETSYAFLPTVLTFGILPAHLFQQMNPAAFPLSDYNLRPIGSGPFIFQKTRKDSQGTIRTVELKRNANFFKTPPYLENIIVKLFATREELMAALSEKSIDAAGILPEPYTPLPAHITDHFLAISASFPQYTGLFFNARKNSWLQYKEIRQALSLAIPKQTIAEQLYQGDVSVINTPLLPGVDVQDGNKDGNSSEAQKIFQAWRDSMKPKPARTTTKKVKTPEPPAPTPTITLTASSTKGQLAIAQKIADAWNALGIPTTVNTIDSAKIKRDIIKPRDYEVLLFSLKTDGAADPYIFWHTSQRDWPGLNLSGFSDTNADTLITQARGLNDEKAREDTYTTLATILNTHIPAIPLWSYHYTYLVSRSFSHITLKGLSNTQDRFTRVAEWYIKQQRSW